jgi:hypothetical protein
MRAMRELWGFHCCVLKFGGTLIHTLLQEVHNYRPNEVSLAERTNKQNAPHLVRILPFVKVVRDRPRRTYRGIVDESPAPHACQFLYL